MTVPHYGKRSPGGLTAASPGDTLYFNYGSYNDSGDSEAQSGFAVSDIEVFKNGQPTARATDSGYSLISDTGQMGDRVGLNRFSISLFNTSDDTGFYDASWYQVAVDSVTIDGKTVRHWAGSFEIGTPRANVVEIDGDTGFADRLGKLASLLSASGQIDTGTISGGFIPSNVRQIAGDTGAAVHLAQFSDEYDTGRIAAEASATLDTGAVHAAVWQVPSGNANRTLTNIDTGAARHLASLGDEYDTGRLPAEATASLDTGAVNQAVWQGNSSRTLTSWSFDTGIQQALARFDTGVTETIDRILADTDTGIQPLDTGQINRAVWAANSSRTLTGFAFDTGVQQAIARLDTGMSETIDRILADTDTGIQPLDTGQINRAVWTANGSRTLTAFAFDTGIQQALARVDTGLSETIDAIQTKTDSLTFTVAGIVDSNIEYVNATQITGTGDTGTGNTWRPA